MRYSNAVIMLCLGVILLLSACQIAKPNNDMGGTESTVNFGEQNETGDMLNCTIEPIPETELAKEQINEPKSNEMFYPDIEHITKLFSMNQSAVLEWLGDSYEIIAAGAENTSTGYYYNSYGVVLLFDLYKEEERIWLIECTNKVDVNGARLGMTFAEILECLPESEIFSYSHVDDDNLYYALKYELENISIIFNADRDTEGETVSLSVMRK